MEGIAIFIGGVIVIGGLMAVLLMAAKWGRDLEDYNDPKK